MWVFFDKDNKDSEYFFPCAFKHQTRTPIPFNEERTIRENYTFIKNKKRQAGAELCQAQGKLILFRPWLDTFLLWLTNMVWIYQFGLWIKQV